MIACLTLLLGCQLAGELLVIGLGLPVPGPVIGMALLFLGLCVKGSLPAALGTTADGIFRHFILMFLPAGVGVMVHVDMILEAGTAVVAAIVGSTLLTIVVTALVMQRLGRATLDDASRKN
jgi:holin-like protein